MHSLQGTVGTDPPGRSGTNLRPEPGAFRLVRDAFLYTLFWQSNEVVRFLRKIFVAKIPLNVISHFNVNEKKAGFLWRYLGLDGLRKNPNRCE